MPSATLALLFLLHGVLSVDFMVTNYTVDMEAGYLCPENDQLEIPMKLFRVDRINRTHRAMTMEFSYAHPLDDTAEGVHVVERWIAGGWKRFPMWSWQKDPCNFQLQHEKNGHIRFGKAMGLKHPERCPIPAGNYSVVRFPFQLKYDYPFWPGRIRTIAMSRRIATKQLIFCVMTILNVVERV
ncbi:uncharacterized protein LOC103314014 [Tribolium castaneum]|uniref:uncharacterized protein LOC103314014 n=1 Tax=Tribolium castaneum TaxID=7070 RepID=UPI0030FEAF9E